MRIYNYIYPYIIRKQLATEKSPLFHTRSTLDALTYLLEFHRVYKVVDINLYSFIVRIPFTRTYEISSVHYMLIIFHLILPNF